jgi:IS1 family transposase
MQCPECSSTDTSKSGKQRGKQNYICKACRRQFIETYDPPPGYYWDTGLGDRRPQQRNVQALMGQAVSVWKCYFWVTDGWPVYPMFIPAGDQIVSKTYMTRVEGENTRLRHYLARLHR